MVQIISILVQLKQKFGVTARVGPLNKKSIGFIKGCDESANMLALYFQSDILSAYDKKSML